MAVHANGTSHYGADQKVVPSGRVKLEDDAIRFMSDGRIAVVDAIFSMNN
jgi:hypothetical protein